MPNERSSRAEVLAQRVGALAQESGLSVGVAESLTGGAISSALAAAEESSAWFDGGIVAYQSRVKFDLLGVAPGPVVTLECASQMAVGARDLLGSDVAVAATGAGGPGSVEGQPPGTVFIAVADHNDTAVHEFRFNGSPSEVVGATVESALRLLADTIRDHETTTGQAPPVP